MVRNLAGLSDLYEGTEYYSYEEYITDCMNPERSYMRWEHNYPKSYDDFYKLTGVEVEYYLKGEKKNAYFDKVYSSRELVENDVIYLSYNRLTRSIAVIEDM